jgi:hypothetical protein
MRGGMRSQHAGNGRRAAAVERSAARCPDAPTTGKRSATECYCTEVDHNFYAVRGRRRDAQGARALDCPLCSSNWPGIRDYAGARPILFDMLDMRVAYYANTDSLLAWMCERWHSDA